MKEKEALVLVVVIFAALFLVSHIGNHIDNKEVEREEKKVHCYVAQDIGPKLRGTSCTQLNDNIVAVSLYLVDRTIHVHPSRVEWNDGKKTDKLEQQLLKPIRNKR